MDKREQLLDIMEDAAKGETKATLRARIAELETENARLVREAEHWKIYSSGQGKLIESGVFVSNDEYGRLSLLEAALNSSRSEVAEALKVLGPFAEVIVRAEESSNHFGRVHSHDVTDNQEYGVLGVTWGHLRAARAFVEKHGGKE